MDLINKIIEDIYRKQMSTTTEKYVVDAFQKHFGISIDDVDLREIEHMVVEGDPISSYRYRGETFLYMNMTFDVNTDPQGGILVTIKCKEV